MATIHLHNESGYTQHIRARNHAFLADEPLDNHGTDAGPAPYELLLAALSACTSLTLRMYAERKGWSLGSIQVDARFSRDDCGLENIERSIVFGNVMSQEQLQRLGEICEKTPVTKTLRQGTPIHTTFA